ncbi:MAG: glycosyl hydrolase 108 family protein [Rhodocyclaceae bacterium]|nr:glycosyl hydrolase 108 family protein [Rhodocyclaceae bacterium]
MADFLPAFEKMILNEGGYRLTHISGDRGGQTYAGIARNAWAKWEGWSAIDRGETPSADLVRSFYREHFWSALQGDALVSAPVAQTLFDFAVNAGVRTAVILAQTVVGVTPDGNLGPKTLVALNAADAEKFILAYALAKIARYAQIVTKDRSQQKFLLGWVNRTLGSLKELAA